MQKKVIKYSLSIALLLFIGYHSIYFRKLDEVKPASASKGFDAKAYAGNFYNSKLLPQIGNAIELGKLVALLKTQPDNTFKTYSHALGIGNIKYFLVQGEGTLSSITEDAVSVSLKNDTVKTDIKIATEFVYGNAIRDASGLVKLNDFTNTADFNSISEEVNKIVRKDVLPQFKAKANPGDMIKFTGAIELNQAHINLDSIEVVPVQLLIVK